MSSSIEARVTLDAPGRFPLPDARLELRDLERALVQMLELVPARQRTVLLLRCGYAPHNYGERWTLNQIAEFSNCSKQRVAQLQEHAERLCWLYRAPVLLALYGECDERTRNRFDHAQHIQQLSRTRQLQLEAAERERRRRQVTIDEHLARVEANDETT